jgi:serine/threonine-protein kinase
MKPSTRFPLCAAAALALTSLAPRAGADDARATAQALFDDAVQAMKERAYDRACPKLEEVVRLQPGKVGAMMQLAQCYEDAGKIVSAWSRYRAAADAAAPSDDRGPKARARAEELAKRIPKLTLAVAPANRALRGFSLTRAGREMGAAEWDTALPVDPGRYEIVASAPGKKSWTGSIEVTAGGAPVTVQIPALPALKDEGSPTVVAQPRPATPPPAAPPSTTQPAHDGSSSPKPPAWAWVATGAGLAALGVAAGFGIDGLMAKNSIAARCHGLSPCPGLDQADADSLNGRKDRGLAVFIGAGVAGAAGVAAGLAGLLGGPRAAAKDAGVIVVVPAIGPGLGGASIEGRF